jgi:hypothetical protein
MARQIISEIPYYIISRGNNRQWIFNDYYTLWSLPQFQISVIPACPESFRKDSRRASLAGMTPINKHSNNGRPAVSAAGFFILKGVFLKMF